MHFATVRLTTGPELHYAEYGDEDGEPVVFLHGWPDSWFSFSAVVPLLPQRIHGFVPDQRGFGDSERPEGAYSIATFADDAAAFIKAMGIDRATVVGHSFGSFVTRQLAHTHPDLVARMVLIGTAVTAVSPATREAESIVRDLTDPVSETFARAFQSSTLYVPLPEAFFEGLLAESLKLPARLWRETFAAVLAYRDEDRLTSIAAPTLLLWGEHDALFARADQEQLTATIPGARLRIYPETGHCPNWERPELVAEDIVQFLDESQSA